jgi:hypothetical protein
MKKKICKTCYYFVPSTEYGGNCHFNAPFVTETEWPHVYEKDFCGQWKDRNEKTS